MMRVLTPAITALMTMIGATAQAATLTVTTDLRPAWFVEGSGNTVSAGPVTLEIEFDETQTGSLVEGQGWVTIAGVRQQGVKGQISFTTISGSASANGNVMRVGVVLDDQPFVDRSIFVPGRGRIPIFVDENPDQLPIQNIDLNTFDIHLYGTPGGVTPFANPIGDTIADFLATERQAGQRVRYYPSPFQSQI